MSDCRWWCEGNWLCWEETSPARCRDRAFDCSSNSRKRRLYDSTCQDETISQDFKDSRMSLHLLAQLGVLHHGVLLVELKAADAIKTFEVEPAAPSDAHSVQDHRRLQVQLQPTSCYSSAFDCQSRSVSIFLPKAGEYFVRTTLRRICICPPAPPQLPKWRNNWPSSWQAAKHSAQHNNVKWNLARDLNC